MVYTVEATGLGFEIWVNEGMTMRCARIVQDRKSAYALAGLWNSFTAR